jgi:hypothetical protein
MVIEPASGHMAWFATSEFTRTDTRFAVHSISQSIGSISRTGSVTNSYKMMVEKSRGKFACGLISLRSFS